MAQYDPLSTHPVQIRSDLPNSIIDNPKPVDTTTGQEADSFFHNPASTAQPSLPFPGYTPSSVPVDPILEKQYQDVLAPKKLTDRQKTGQPELPDNVPTTPFEPSHRIKDVQAETAKIKGDYGKTGTEKGGPPQEPQTKKIYNPITGTYKDVPNPMYQPPATVGHDITKDVPGVIPPDMNSLLPPPNPDAITVKPGQYATTPEQAAHAKYAPLNGNVDPARIAERRENQQHIEGSNTPLENRAKNISAQYGISMEEARKMAGAPTNAAPPDATQRLIDQGVPPKDAIKIANAQNTAKSDEANKILNKIGLPSIIHPTNAPVPQGSDSKATEQEVHDLMTKYPTLSRERANAIVGQNNNKRANGQLAPYMPSTEQIATSGQMPNGMPATPDGLLNYEIQRRATMLAHMRGKMTPLEQQKDAYNYVVGFDPTKFTNDPEAITAIKELQNAVKNGLGGKASDAERMLQDLVKQGIKGERTQKEKETQRLAEEKIKKERQDKQIADKERDEQTRVWATGEREYYEKVIGKLEEKKLDILASKLENKDSLISGIDAQIKENNEKLKRANEFLKPQWVKDKENEGRTATGPGGAKIIFHNGKWMPL